MDCLLCFVFADGEKLHRVYAPTYYIVRIFMRSFRDITSKRGSSMANLHALRLKVDIAHGVFSKIPPPVSPFDTLTSHQSDEPIIVNVESCRAHPLTVSDRVVLL